MRYSENINTLYNSASVVRSVLLYLCSHYRSVGINLGEISIVLMIISNEMPNNIFLCSFVNKKFLALLLWLQNRAIIYLMYYRSGSGNVFLFSLLCGTIPSSRL